MNLTAVNLEERHCTKYLSPVPLTDFSATWQQDGGGSGGDQFLPPEGLVPETVQQFEPPMIRSTELF